MKDHFFRLIKFGFISSIGLLIDVVIYLLFIEKNIPVNYSSALGSICAIIFVYFSSSFFLLKKISPNKIHFIIWALYQAISIVIFSNFVLFIYTFGISPLEAKLLTIPASFICNYVFINLILKI